MNIFRQIFSSSKKVKNWRQIVFVIILLCGSLLVNFGDKYNDLSDKLSEKSNISIPKVEERSFRLGLDLLGGTHLVYKANIDNIPDTDRDNALEGVRDVIERRVNLFGVSEPNVQTAKSNGEYRVIVELAGINDVNEAISLIGETPLLEFKEASDEARQLGDEEKAILENYNIEAEKGINEALEELVDSDFEDLVLKYSQDEATKENKGNIGWITASSHPEIINAISELELGAVTKNYITSQSGFEIYKLLEKRIKTNPFDENKEEKQVLASHILICHKDSESCESELSKEEAYAKIKEVKTKVTAENFNELAKVYSDEPGADQTGGNLGWFERGRMIKPFEDTVFNNQKVGEISYVVETKFGYHLILKHDEKNIEEYNISRILIRTMSEQSIVGVGNTWKNTKLGGKYLKRAAVQFDYNDNSPEVTLEFDQEGSDLFAEITERNIGKQVAIFLDGYPISAPVVNSKITGGQAVISGNFDIKEANLLTQRLNAGALPVPISLISQKTIGASLGQDSMQKSLKAGIFGLIAVAIFMVFIYRLPGILAVVSLLIYGLLMLAIFKLWPITLTLSGLAGFILSIGMAVDANILIFERLKEELNSGHALSTAIDNGFKRAWPSIRDGNISTLLTCFILIQFTTSVVMGFALTLALGVIVSIFSAVIITKNLLVMVSGAELFKKNKFWL
ncbi:protein translocase subunit SecD [Patescibacteria group bacterium]|nr:protein translocase subunit SecD [Patescibacteria group bacterium]